MNSDFLTPLYLKPEVVEFVTFDWLQRFIDQKEIYCGK